MDIAFLKSQVSSGIPNRPSITDAWFWNVSIITCLNSLKDEINHLGVLRFAEESNHNLVDFFSIDTLPLQDVKDASRNKKRCIKQMPWRAHKEMTKHGKINPNI
jgi:hypothetical protein